MENGFKYILRFTLAPGVEEESRLDALLRFASEAKLDNVMFFIRGEELSSGHTTLAEVDRWLETISNAGKKLADIGVTFSVNPWETILHADEGGSLDISQNFARMVDRNGRQARQVACPSDPAFREYVLEKYRRIASIHPDRIWLDDDCRLHNHKPLEWGGGCFCERHMEIISERVGKKVTREEFVNGVTAVGEVHPYRKIWLDLAREEINGLITSIKKTVVGVDDNIGMGLMVSYPEWHMAEGRDWEEYCNAGTTEKRRPAIRIPIPGYGEMASSDYSLMFMKISHLIKAMLPEDVEAYTEVENYPMTRFNKSDSFTRHQTEDALMLSAPGATLDLYAFSGNGVLPTERNEIWLSEAKPFMSKVKSLGFDTAKAKGVKVMYDPRASYNICSCDATSVSGLYPRETKWAELFTMYGISFGYCDDKNIKGETVAVSGQYFRNLGIDGTKRFLKENFCLLEGEAVMTLDSMGLLGEIGAEKAEYLLAATSDSVVKMSGDEDAPGSPVGADVTPAQYEEMAEGITLCGIKRCRFNTPHGMGVLRVNYKEGADVKVLSDLRTADEKHFCDGMTVVNGNIFILPYLHGSLWQDSTERAEAIQMIIDKKAPYTVNSPFLTLLWCEEEGKIALYLNNNSADDYEDTAISGDVENLKDIRIINRLYPNGRKANAKIKDGRLYLGEMIIHNELTVITAKR